MGEFWDWEYIKDAWVSMLEAPWRHSDTHFHTNVSPRDHWLFWLVGWAWALAGLLFGSLYAPLLLQFAGLATAPYQDWLVIGIAVLAGFLIQLLGWWLVIMVVNLVTSIGDIPWWPVSVVVGLLGLGVIVVAAFLPLAGAGYGVYHYFTSVGTDQRTVNIAFVGGLLVKTLLIPLIKGIVTGALFKWLMDWLRGGKKKGAE